MRPALPHHGVGGVLIAGPLLLAAAGPFLVPDTLTRGVPFVPSHGHLLGTDFVGRDVWHQVLLGGRTLILITLLATAASYLVGVMWALTAAMSRRRWLDEALMRPLDLLLAVPSLLLLLLAAGVARRGELTLIVIVTLVGLPEVVRVARAAALEIANRPVVEAMRLQGESRRRIALGYVCRCMLRTLAADAGNRLTASLYLVASASFLGVGVPPDAADWAVMVDRNRSGLFLNPWGVVAPTILIMTLVVGLNLTFDRALGTRRGTRW